MDELCFRINSLNLPPQLLDMAVDGTVADRALGALLPRPPRGTQKRNDTTADGKQQKVWILRNSQLSPVSVKTGETGGGVTEVLAGDLQPGMEIVVDMITSAK